MNSVSDWSTGESGASQHGHAAEGELVRALRRSHSSLSGDDWVDALDPGLPAEPLLVCPQLHESRRPAQWLHKLILLGVALGAGAFAFG